GPRQSVTRRCRGRRSASCSCRHRVDSVPVITLDQFIAEGNPPPRLLKVDVEGGECEVLRGGSKLFDIQRPLLIVEVHHQSACDWLNAWLEDRRYSGKWRIPPESFPRYLFAWPSESMNPFSD